MGYGISANYLNLCWNRYYYLVGGNTKGEYHVGHKQRSLDGYMLKMSWLIDTELCELCVATVSPV